MKRNYYFILMFLAALICSDGAYGQCTNGGLESGNLFGWNTWYGGYNTANNAMTPGVTTLSPFHQATAQVVAFGWDDNLGQQLQRTYDGNNAIRIGDLLNTTDPNVNSSMASFTFTVTNTNKLFRFRYALVMQNYAHASNEQPSFSWYMKLGSGNPAIPTALVDPSWGIYNLTKYTKELPATPESDPYWVHGNPISGPNNIWIRHWTCKQYDLTEWVGQTVTIYYRVKDCVFDGHFGYAYVDALCEQFNPVPAFSLPTSVCLYPVNPGPVTLNGSSTMYEDSYTITIHEQPSGGGPIDMNTWYTQDFIGQVGQIDIRQLYSETNGETRFQCNKTYRVYLTAKTLCGESNMIYKDITFTCPPAIAGPDKTVCCGNSVSIGSSVISRPPPQYSWNPVPTGLSGTSATMTFVPTTNNTYTVTVTDANGCRNFDAVNVIVKRDFELSVSEICPTGNDPIESCSPYYKLTANVTEQTCLGTPVTGHPIYSTYTFTWTYGSQVYTGRTINTPAYIPGQNTIQLHATNGCFSKTITYTISCKKFEGAFPPVIMPNALHPNSAIPENRILRIQEFGNGPNWQIGTNGAYNAFGYHLMIWNRWGDLFYDSGTIIDYTGLEQGQIIWDGRDNQGDLVQMGDYVYKLWLYNCSNLPGSEQYVQWAAGNYCEGGWHTAAWPPDCWAYPKCCDNEVISNVPVFNSSGLYDIFVVY